MNRAALNEGLRRMRFETILDRQKGGGITQLEAAEMLGINERTFRRWRDRFDEEGAPEPVTPEPVTPEPPSSAASASPLPDDDKIATLKPSAASFRAASAPMPLDRSGTQLRQSLAAGI